MHQHWSELYSSLPESLFNWGLHIFISEIIQNATCTANSGARTTHATEPTVAATATTTGTDLAETNEAASAEAGAAEHSIGILVPPALAATNAAGYGTDPADPTTWNFFWYV